MGLIERLMKWGDIEADDTVTYPPSPGEYIPVHTFESSIVELLVGGDVGQPMTVAQVKSFWNMDPADEVDFDAIMAVYQGFSKADAKHRYVHYIWAVFIAGQLTPRVTGHMNPAEVRAKLGL